MFVPRCFWNPSTDCNGDLFVGLYQGEYFFSFLIEASDVLILCAVAKFLIPVAQFFTCGI